MAKPGLILLDEPASGLSESELAELGDLIRDLATEGSLMVVEHHMDLMMSVCDSLVVLDFGKVIATGSPREIQGNPAVTAAYLGTAESGAGTTDPAAAGDGGAGQMTSAAHAADAADGADGADGPGPASRAAPLTVEGLVAGYGGVVTLNGVTVTAQAAGITAVLGANSAGKTTLLRAVSGMIKPRRGQILLGTRDLAAAARNRWCGPVSRTCRKARA